MVWVSGSLGLQIPEHFKGDVKSQLNTVQAIDIEHVDHDDVCRLSFFCWERYWSRQDPSHLGVDGNWSEHVSLCLTHE